MSEKRCSYVHKEMLQGEDTYDPAIDGGDDCQYLSLERDALDIECFKVDGKYWCEFHCPIVDKKGSLTEKGEWGDDEKERFLTKFRLISRDNGSLVEHAKDDYIDDESVDYSGTIFNVRMDFSKRTHSGIAVFSYCEFHDDLDMSYCLVERDIMFRGSTFNGEVNFYQTRFNHGIDFISCTFNHNLNIEFNLKSEFDDNEQRELIKSIDFNGSKFLKKVGFDNRKFKGHSDFSNCIFHVAPNFFGSELHQETDFPHFSRFKDKSDNAIKAYRVLKLSMENVRNREDEGAFFALEQMCLRKSKGILGFISFSYIYELTCLYGLSLVRPLLFLLISTVLFSYLYYDFFYMDLYYGLEAFEYSFKQILKPFSVWSSREAEELNFFYNKIDLISLRLLSALQSVISLSLIGIFLIALRWKFKRG